MATPTSDATRAGEQLGQMAQDTIHQLQEKAGDAVQSIKEAGRHAKSRTREQVENLRGTAAEYWDQGRERAKGLEQTMERQIRDQPVRSALIALGLGFVLGVCFMRR